MLRFLADENLDGPIVDGLRSTRPDLDLVRVQDVGLMAVEDPAILAWAASEGRIVLTHDVSTMTKFAYERVRAGVAMPGVFLVPGRLPVGRAIQEVLFLAENFSPEDFADQVHFLPTR